MSGFDAISKAAFTVVEQIMGDVALWIPLGGTNSQTATVLYKNPENKQTLGDSDKFSYSPYKYSFEFYIDQLQGLKQSIDAGHSETISINGINLDVHEVSTSIDGKTLTAYCEIHE